MFTNGATTTFLLNFVPIEETEQHNSLSLSKGLLNPVWLHFPNNNLFLLCASVGVCKEVQTILAASQNRSY